MLLKKVMVEETRGETVIACSNFSLRQASTPILPLSFWRPWEASCEATGREGSGEATARLSSEGMTPPALVMPPRNEVRSTVRKVGRRLQRLLNFQATLEKEKGLPLSRWQRRLEFGEEGDATFINKPGSHRKKGRRRGWVWEVEASVPKLWGSKVKANRCNPQPNTPGYRELEASKHNTLLVHSSLSLGGWDGGGHRGFCYT